MSGNNEKKKGRLVSEMVSEERRIFPAALGPGKKKKTPAREKTVKFRRRGSRDRKKVQSGHGRSIWGLAPKGTVCPVKAVMNGGFHLNATEARAGHAGEKHWRKWKGGGGG